MNALLWTLSFILWPVWPTWSFANWWKQHGDRTYKIKLLNWVYLGVSVVSFGALWLFIWNDITAVQSPPEWPWARPLAFSWRFLWAWLLCSRCTEIAFAFLRDAYDKIGNRTSHSGLEPRDRLVLAFKSYGELILNFAILFAMCPKNSWVVASSPTPFPGGSVVCPSPPPSPGSLTDVLYFSATTITTSGNGAMIPARRLLQFLSTYEIYCGLILLVVCFTIYTGLGTRRRPPDKRGGIQLGPPLPRRRYM